MRAGTRLRSTVCETEVVVVKAPDGDLDVRCGGQSMVPAGAPGGDDSPSPGFDGGTLVGKRYVDADGSLELLCTKPGAGSLSVGDDLLGIKSAKPLPSSD